MDYELKFPLFTKEGPGELSMQCFTYVQTGNSRVNVVPFGALGATRIRA